MKIFLFVTGVIFLIVGLRALIDPVHAIGDLYGLTASGINGLSQLRASAGGVTVLCGAYMVASCFRPAWTYAALAVTTLILGGLVFGRIVGVVADGLPGTTIYVSFALELFGFVQAAFWLRQHP